MPMNPVNERGPSRPEVNRKPGKINGPVTGSLVLTERELIDCRGT